MSEKEISLSRSTAMAMLVLFPYSSADHESHQTEARDPMDSTLHQIDDADKIDIIILKQNNKENVPPACNSSNSNNNKIKNKKNTNPKRVPLTDITNLFNNSAKTRVSTLPGNTLRMGFR
ncbi:uncharacterized protein HKW66_Vig0146490 [Vigna angularis]|uniref:Uncharacterized protein n=1 Tax=Phaseolus angularis TaxID=3914 RepID=A0A8T0KG51_PHAAN|nr:uncharacterized protein HKW66_Vig0146490 [Vigna angularis]